MLIRTKKIEQGLLHVTQFKITRRRSCVRPDDAEDAIEMPDPTLPFAFT